MNADPDHIFLNPEEAAMYCGTTANALNNYRAVGSGPPFFKVTTFKPWPLRDPRIRYRLSDLDEWIKTRRTCRANGAPMLPTAPLVAGVVS